MEAALGGRKRQRESQKPSLSDAILEADAKRPALSELSTNTLDGGVHGAKPRGASSAACSSHANVGQSGVLSSAGSSSAIQPRSVVVADQSSGLLSAEASCSATSLEAGQNGGEQHAHPSTASSTVVPSSVSSYASSSIGHAASGATSNEIQTSNAASSGVSSSAAVVVASAVQQAGPAVVPALGAAAPAAAEVISVDDDGSASEDEVVFVSSTGPTNPPAGPAAAATASCVVARAAVGTGAAVKAPGPSAAGAGAASSLAAGAGAGSGLAAQDLITPTKPPKVFVPGSTDGTAYLATYSNSMLSSCKEDELAKAPKHGYLSIQHSVNELMRLILVDWLVDVHYRHKLHSETLFLAVNLIDRYLERVDIKRDRLQLVGVASLWIASKYVEEWRHEVTAKDMATATDNYYTIDEIKAMESSVLNTLDFRISVPTAYTFVIALAREAKLAEDDPAVHMANYLCELCMMNYSFLRFVPSQIASAALNIGMRSLYGNAAWSAYMALVSGYSQQALVPVIASIQSSALGSSGPLRDHIANYGPIESIFRKYLSTKRSEVAKHPIAAL